jgi:uncharacterized membrane protein YhhN
MFTSFWQACRQYRDGACATCLITVLLLIVISWPEFEVLKWPYAIFVPIAAYVMGAADARHAVKRETSQPPAQSQGT